MYIPNPDTRRPRLFHIFMVPCACMLHYVLDLRRRLPACLPALKRRPGAFEAEASPAHSFLPADGCLRRSIRCVVGGRSRKEGAREREREIWSRSRSTSVGGHRKKVYSLGPLGRLRDEPSVRRQPVSRWTTGWWTLSDLTEEREEGARRLRSLTSEAIIHPRDGQVFAIKYI